MAQWVTDKNATPAMFHTLKEGRKSLITIRRVTGEWVKSKAGLARYKHHYQIVVKWHGIAGAAYGPIYTSLAKAKKVAEKAVANKIEGT